MKTAFGAAVASATEGNRMKGELSAGFEKFTFTAMHLACHGGQRSFIVAGLTCAEAHTFLAKVS